MTDISHILDQAQLFMEQHAPQLLDRSVSLAVVFLIAGIGLSVLGAKLAPYGIAASFAGLGGLAGWHVAGQTAFPTPVCTVVGAAAMGIVGFLTFRLWVGVTAAVVLSALTLGVFSYQRLAPHVADFQTRKTAIVTVDPISGATVQIAVPTPEEREAYLSRSPADWFKQFWDFVTQRDANVSNHAKALSLGALLSGLLLGVLAVRFTLIVATSLIGTVLVTTGITTLLTQSISIPNSYQALQNHPGAVGMGIGGFLVTSLILQALLMRRPPSKPVKKQAKS